MHICVTWCYQRALSELYNVAVRLFLTGGEHLGFNWYLGECGFLSSRHQFVPYGARRFFRRIVAAVPRFVAFPRQKDYSFGFERDEL